MQNSALLTTSDAARLAQCSSETIRYWQNTGKLHAERTASGVRLFRREDVERFAAERRADEKSPDTVAV